MIKRILVLYSKKAFENKKFLNLIENILKNKKLVYEFLLIDDFNNKHLKKVDLVIVLGGDGTFIRASHLLTNQFILGINSDFKTSEGGLMSLNEKNIKKLNEILEGKYKILLRERIDLFLNKKLLAERGLNEVYVGTKDQFHTSRYIIEFKNKKEEQRSSGVLISTGTGSTVWYKSAGGKPFKYNEKKLKFLVREPFSGRLYKSKILKGEIKGNEKIKFHSKRCFGGIIAIDSNITYEFNEGNFVELKLSKSPLKVLEKI